MALANNLKPTRRKLQNYFNRPSYSTHNDSKDWSVEDVSAAIKQATSHMEDMGRSEVPISPVSPVVQDTRYKPSLVPIADEEEPDSDDGAVYPTIETVMPPPPRPPAPRQSPPAVPAPNRVPPPPPVAELDSVGTVPKIAIPIPPRLKEPARRPVAASRRQAKTPVRHIGQLELAAAKKRQDAAINRNVSIRSLARQYRTLVDETDIPELKHAATIYRKPLPPNAKPYLHDMRKSSPQPSVAEQPMASMRDTPQPPYELPSSPISDDGTLVAFVDDSICIKPTACAAPPTPPSSDKADDDEKMGEDKESALPPDTNTLRLQIGFELLTRELSSAFVAQSAQRDRDASGLQIWIMIEAYERLRDQIAAKESHDPELKSATAMFDSWLAALHSIRRSMADEAAERGSEYGDN